MNILDKIKNGIRKGVNRMAESTGLFKKDVFELDGVPAFREYYTLLFLLGRQSIRAFTENGTRSPCGR